MRSTRIAALLGLAWLSAGASAQRIDYAFSGSLSFASSTSLGVSPTASFAGEFWFDVPTLPNSVEPTSAGGTEGWYTSGGISLAIDGLPLVLATPGQILVDDNPEGATDAFRMNFGQAPIRAGTGDLMAFGYFAVYDASGTAFSSAALPTALDDRFRNGVVFVDFFRPDGSFDFVAGNVAELHAVPAVPEPEIGVSMLAGLGALIAFARRGPSRTSRRREGPRQ